MASLITNDGTAGAAAKSGGINSAIGANGEISNLFTTLLVAQIKNQNPLEPTDPAEFVAQLTQLSQTETLQNLSSQTTLNGALLESLQTLGLGGQVGGRVTVSTDAVSLGGTAVGGSFELSAASSKTTLVLTADNGTERRIELGTQAAGTVPFSLDRNALGLPAGTYAVRVEAENQASPSVSVLGTLSSVRLAADGSVVVDVSGVGETAPDAITAFHGRANAQP
ncbi:MAG: flagellar hook capping FlgD N-terminal domain-containing protein [Aquincola tertiaricarbonis]|uniref:flagellar hook capping FlgD N-terminal domain-containing protein n=1 Tax=Aquincola TaxID=391952 RepID=UPI00061532A6|nr:MULTISPECIES: flagellar hook capping FlgD N-terminal domain-containing protein [Aquincola]MCR5869195.1 flagellar basal body rod modification protein [Aquincola sp. J276]